MSKTLYLPSHVMWLFRKITTWSQGLDHVSSTIPLDLGCTFSPAARKYLTTIKLCLFQKNQLISNSRQSCGFFYSPFWCIYSQPYDLRVFSSQVHTELECCFLMEMIQSLEITNPSRFTENGKDIFVYIQSIKIARFIPDWRTHSVFP